MSVDYDRLSGGRGARIAAAVGEMCNLAPGAIFSRTRVRAIVRARQLAFWVIHVTLPEFGYSQIGRIFGDFDHSTISHGIGCIEDLRLRDPGFRAFSDEVLAALSGARTVFGIDEDRRAEIAAIAARHLQQPEPGWEMPDRDVRPRNDLLPCDAEMIVLGSQQLAAAMRSEHPERCG